MCPTVIPTFAGMTVVAELAFRRATLAEEAKEESFAPPIAAGYFAAKALSTLTLPLVTAALAASTLALTLAGTSASL